jgi:hypothetical protein
VVARVFAVPLVQAIAAGVLSLIPMLIAAHGRSTMFNNYVRVAYAWLQGRMWIDYPGPWLDATKYQGHWYGVDAPFPAVLMLPFTMLWGMNANETLVCIGLAGACIGAAYYLLYRLNVPLAPRIALAIFLFAGTDLFWCAELGDVWFMAHVCAVLCTLLALIECMGKRRAWLVALLAFAAFESRFTMIMAIPLYIYLLRTGELGAPSTTDWRKLEGFGWVMAFGAVLWLTYNKLMWGTWNDIGHTIYFHADSWGHPTGSPFQLAYLPYQFYSFFLQAPVLVEWLQQAQYPFFKVDPHGVALTFTSPALILAFFARAPKRLTMWLWFTVALVAAPSFLYYLNGWYQFGMRHALDFEPFMLVLMGFAARDGLKRIWYALIAWSAAVGTWGVWYWGVFFRTGN